MPFNLMPFKKSHKKAVTALMSWLFLAGVAGFAGAVNSAKEKVLPAHLQKAYIIQKNALVYTRPDFDSMQISQIPAGQVVTISKKIYRPPNRFGTFYRIYLKKPKKIKAYISEIDVTPRYIRSGSSYKLNPAFAQVKKKLKYVKDFQFNSSEPEDLLDLTDKPLSSNRFIGLVASRSWMAYKGQEQLSPLWLFGLRLTGPGLPINKVLTDFSFLFSFPPLTDNKIFINQKQIKKSWLLMGDFLLKFVLLSAPRFELYLSGGLMANMKGAFSPQESSPVSVGVGAISSLSLILKMRERISLLVEGQAGYDFSEKAFFPSARMGLLVAF